MTLVGPVGVRTRADGARYSRSHHRESSYCWSSRLPRCGSESFGATRCVNSRGRSTARLMSPPPSPYAPSKGFRLLDGPVDSETRRPEPPRPRLEIGPRVRLQRIPDASESEVVPTHLRHNEKWALSKSARRSASFTGLRVAVIALIVVVIVGVARTSTSSTGTDKNGSPTTTTHDVHRRRPRRRRRRCRHRSSRRRRVVRPRRTDVPRKSYNVVVDGALGPTWAVYKMGPSEHAGVAGHGRKGHRRVTADDR